MSLDPRQVLRQEGRLVLGPTDLSTTYPFGGTELGYWARGEVVVDQEPPANLLSQSTGHRYGQVFGVTFIGFEFDMLQFDTTILGKVWNYAAGILRDPIVGGTATPGLQAATTNLLFYPYDTAQPSMLIYNPSFRLASGSRIPLALLDIRKERIRVDAQDDVSGRQFAVGPVASLG